MLKNHQLHILVLKTSKLITNLYEMSKLLEEQIKMKIYFNIEATT